MTTFVAAADMTTFVAAADMTTFVAAPEASSGLRSRAVPLLEIEGISRQYGLHAWGLRDISLRLRSGLLALLGPNGAGKTTLMRILATLDRPTSGSAGSASRISYAAPMACS